MSYVSNSLDAREYLLLPDGRRADALRFTPLLAELRRIGVSGIHSDMTKIQLLDRYQEVISAALRSVPKHHGGPVPLTAIVAKQAAAVVAQQSAAGFASEAIASPPPRPIASTKV